MRVLNTSYNGEWRERQSPLSTRSLAILVFAVALTGCTGIGTPFNGISADRQITTGSIHKVNAKNSELVDQSDWEAVRRSIAGAEAKGHYNRSIDWRNPDTGTTGAITISDSTTTSKKRNCRKFATTINDTRGIRHYRGDACLMRDNRWQLFGVLADDSKLL